MLFSGAIAKIAVAMAAIVIVGGAVAGGAIAASGHVAGSSKAGLTTAAQKAGLVVPVKYGDTGTTEVGSDDQSGRTAPSLPDSASDNAKAVIDAVFSADPHDGDVGSTVSGVASDGKAGGTKAATSTTKKTTSATDED